MDLLNTIEINLGQFETPTVFEIKYNGTTFLFKYATEEQVTEKKSDLRWVYVYLSKGENENYPVVEIEEQLYDQDGLPSTDGGSSYFGELDKLYHFYEDFNQVFSPRKEFGLISDKPQYRFMLNPSAHQMYTSSDKLVWYSLLAQALNHLLDNY